jgi:hypothetical protein
MSSSPFITAAIPSRSKGWSSTARTVIFFRHASVPFRSLVHLRVSSLRKALPGFSDEIPWDGIVISTSVPAPGLLQMFTFAQSFPRATTGFKDQGYRKAGHYAATKG